jgi:hypothetical protein
MAAAACDDPGLRSGMAIRAPSNGCSCSCCCCCSCSCSVGRDPCTGLDGGGNPPRGVTAPDGGSATAVCGCEVGGYSGSDGVTGAAAGCGGAAVSAPPASAPVPPAAVSVAIRSPATVRCISPCRWPTSAPRITPTGCGCGCDCGGCGGSCGRPGGCGNVGGCGCGCCCGGGCGCCAPPSRKAAAVWTASSAAVTVAAGGRPAASGEGPRGCGRCRAAGGGKVADADDGRGGGGRLDAAGACSEAHDETDLVLGTGWGRGGGRGRGRGRRSRSRVTAARRCCRASPG